MAINEWRSESAQELTPVRSAKAGRRGQLKVFFGAAAGVGKTCAMLRAAHERAAGNLDVVVGWVETHGRSGPEVLLVGLERLPPRLVDHRGIRLREFDLGAALARRPCLLLVDELAHANAPGGRHARRWQDVEELLIAGIDVWTTLNVQQLESLNDVVAQITGVTVRETVPDRFFEEADEVELVDLASAELVKRLKSGKVYGQEQAERALDHFFVAGNLTALRELALRRTAAHVDLQRQDHRRDGAWPAADRILVCVGPGPLASRLVRAARRLAAGLRSEWIVLHVEDPAAGALAREQVLATLRLAERLGAQTATAAGPDAAEEILAFARSRNANRIVVGKPARPRWKEVLFGSVVDELVRRSGLIDVYVISGDEEPPASRLPRSGWRTAPWNVYARSLAVVIAATAVAWLMFNRLAPVNIVMVYLLGVVFVAARYGRGPATLASILSVAAFDFCFVPPYLSFAVSDTQYLVTFAVMLTVALLISGLTDRVRRQAEVARERERRTAALYAMGREFAGASSLELLAAVAARHIGAVFESEATVLLPDDRQYFTPPGGVLLETEAACWAYEHDRPAGAHTDTLAAAAATYLPLMGGGGTVGVLQIRAEPPERLADPEQFHLLETFASQTALAIERLQLAREAEAARLQAETEQMRSTLLSSVSHDLRTPLAVIAGITSSLLVGPPAPEAERRSALEAVYSEAGRLNRLVGNLLEMTRLESGTLQVHKEWQPLEEVVGAAVGRLDRPLADRPLQITLAPDLPLVPLDAVLIEQVLINLLDNAVRYTPAGSPLDLSAHCEGDGVTVELADRGAGLSPKEEERVFEKFYRVAGTGVTGGAGLGLAICRGMIAAHGGRIEAANRPGGGAIFRFHLPIDGKPPALEREEEQ